MRRFTKALLVCAAIVVVPMPLSAQDQRDGAAPTDIPEEDQRDPATDPDESQIIVRGGRPEEVSRSDVQRQARAIAGTGDVYDRPLARFEDPLCPGIIGLAADQASLIIDRVRDIAVDLDLRLQDDGCDANFIIMFTPDSRSTLRGMMDRQPALFQFHDAGEKREMLAPGPARVFTVVRPRTRDGMAVGQARDLTNPPVLSTAMAHSKIYTAIRYDITSVTVMLDTDAVKGKSLNQLADYAAMRGLAQTRPIDDPAMDSILTLFDAEAPPMHMTRFDLAYLRSVYEWIPNLPAITRINGVNRQLRKLDEELDERDAER